MTESNSRNKAVIFEKCLCTLLRCFVSHVLCVIGAGTEAEEQEPYLDIFTITAELS